MNQKQLLMLAALVAVLGGVGLVLSKKQAATYQGTERSDEKLLPGFVPDAVTGITIRQQGQSVHLVKSGDRWVVSERAQYPANFDQITELVRKVAELKPVQTQEVGPSQWGRLELLEPGPATNSALALTFEGAGGKTLATLWLGKKTVKKGEEAESQFGGGGDFPNGRFVAVPEKKGFVYVVTDPLFQADPKPESWLSKDFFKAEKVKAVTHASDVATNDWKFSRENESALWMLTDAKPEEKLDANKASTAATSLSYPNFADVVLDKTDADTGLDKPTVLTLETFDKFTYTLKVGSKMAGEDNYVKIAVQADLPAKRTPGKDEKPEDAAKLDKEFAEANAKLTERLQAEQALAKWTYVLPKWTLESLLKPRHEFYEGKKEEGAEPAEGAGAPAGLPPGFDPSQLQVTPQ